MTHLELVELSKRFDPELAAVRHLSLDVQSGERMVLLGPSGCGKTTTLRMIAGLISPTSGDIRLDGNSALHLPPEKRKVVMVFQDDSLFPFMSVGDNVAFGLRQRSVNARSRKALVNNALSAVDLAGFAARRPHELSGGQRQRVALARALVLRPKVLLLDEPFNQLDRGLRQELREMLVDLQRDAGITTLFVTHNQREALQLADRIALMAEGRLVQVGTPLSFFEQPNSADVVGFFGASNLIPGFRRGDIVETAFGEIRVKSGQMANGPVWLVVRLEAIEVGANGRNTFKAAVQARQFQGQQTRYRLTINNTSLDWQTSPFAMYEIGQRLDIHIPADRLTVLPR